MDAVSRLRERPVASAAQPAHAALPAEAPLEMTVQSLSRVDACIPPETSPNAADPKLARSMALRRSALFAGTAALTAFAAHEMYLVLQVAGLTLLEHVVLVVFVVLFTWVAFSFVTNLAGFFSLLADGARAIDDGESMPSPRLSSRTALLYPVYNEDAARVMARLQAMHESLAATGALAHFDFYVLSDTTNPGIRLDEEIAFRKVREETGGDARIFYRHRSRNEGRKAGNVADWVRRFGGRYEQMVVLDADSLMSGETLVRLADEMQRSSDLGSIQTLPAIVNASTVFARLQQFANRLYGPMLGHGLAWWHGSESNYWGHNAMLRTRAFAGNAGLPVLAGRKPFGGEILSHDFVEAALMRRAGWAIRIAPQLGGSYEEAPPALADFAARDRRWCQGNLQHAGVLAARGLHPASRLHLLSGIAAYATAPLWLAFLLVGILIALQAQYIRPEYFPQGLALFPQWPAQDPVRAAWVFAGTIALLVAPKLLAWIATVVRSDLRRAFGGGLRSLAGMLFETIASGLMAPVMMLDQSLTVVAALTGRDAGWNAQRRDDGRLSSSQVARAYAGHTLFGIVLGAAAYAVSWSLFLWMTPVVLGLLLSIPLAIWTGTQGPALRRIGLLRVPEEGRTPAILARANELVGVIARALPRSDAISRLASDAALASAHEAMIETRPRRRGDVDVDLAVGMAKLDEAETLHEARTMLSDRELNAVLSDRRGFRRLLSLRREA